MDTWTKIGSDIVGKSNDDLLKLYFGFSSDSSLDTKAENWRLNGNNQEAYVHVYDYNGSE